MTAKELNRVFILGGKGATEEEWRKAFEPFGTIENIWITKDRKTGQDKGITYITFEKTSEACLAVQEMNLKYIANSERPLKVILASDKRDGSKRSVDEDKMLLRLFIVIPKGQEESDIRSHFESFGAIDHIRVIKDRRSRHPKPLAYVTFQRQYDAAKALEECDRAYKPMFADMKRKEDEQHSEYSRDGRQSYDDHSSRDYRVGSSVRSGYNSSSTSSSVYHVPPVGGAPQDLLQSYPHWSEYSVEALVPEVLGQEHVYRLFDLVPGMRSCHLDRKTGIAYVQYSTPQSASYARDKVNNMEYPLGYRIAVRFPVAGQRSSYTGPTQDSSLSTTTQVSPAPSAAGIPAGGPVVTENIQSLVDSIQKATQVLQSAGLTSPTLNLNLDNVHYCNVSLPPKKPYAVKDALVEERLFIVSQPERFDDGILEDMLCRFGNLISAHFMAGKTYGYAKFASRESAEDAIKVLHGQQVCGNRIKVMIADPPKYERQDDESNSKRRRYDDNSG